MSDSVTIVTTIIFLCLTSIILLPMGCYVIHVHNNVAKWPTATALPSIMSKVKTNFGSISSNAQIESLAYFTDPNQTFSVIIHYPSPPKSLNLKPKNDVKQFISFISSSNEVEIMVDMDPKLGVRNGTTYYAVSENIGVFQWWLIVILSVLWWICFIIGISCFCCS